MWNRSYDVMMQTPIGVRYGTMSVTVDDSIIDGVLDILKRSNPFHGKIDEKGDCQIKSRRPSGLRKTMS